MKEELARRLKACREETRLTQSIFGEKIGVKKPTYAAWEIGSKSPPAYAIAQIEEVFGFDASWILRGPGLKPKRVIIPERVSEITFDLWVAARDAGIELQKSPAIELAVQIAEIVDTEQKQALDRVIQLYKARGT